MAVLETRGAMNLGDKIWGILPDRVIVGRHVADRSFTPLALTDPRKDFLFCDFKMEEAYFKATFLNNSISSGVADGVSSPTNMGGLLLTIGNKVLAMDHFTPPLCYSSSLAGYRNYNAVTTYICNHLGNFKGPNPIFTVDNTGSAGDYFPPGTKLMVSQGGVLHKYVENEAIDVMRHKVVSITDPFANVNGVSGLPIHVGHSPRSASFGYAYRAMANSITFPITTSGYPSRMNHINYSELIGQDATYIYYLQSYDNYSVVSNYQYNYSSYCPPELIELISIRKSDSNLVDLPMTSAQLNVLCSIGGRLITEVTTTEATPKKVIYTVFIPSYQKNGLVFGKITNNAFVNIGSLNLNTAFNDYSKMQPTQLMENKHSGFSDYWKFYLPTITGHDNWLAPILIRHRKTLTENPTQTDCTITGLPAEYASTNGTKMKALVAGNFFDATYAAEIYDGTDQYLAYWMGRTRASYTCSAANSNSYSEVSDTKYRFFIVFKVDPTDDSKLIYQSSVPEFKNAKPMHCSVASPDNKHIVLANEDGILCLAWSTTLKGFICVDNIAMPGVVSLGMDEVNSTGRNTVWAEVLENTTNGSNVKSYLVQIDFGDYEDVDLRYYTGSSYINDFGKINLPVSKDGSNNFEAKTATFEVRVKSKVESVEAPFTVGKTVKLKIEGIKDSDEVSFVGADSGIPYQKTITTTGDWLSFTINYKYPIANFKITSEIL